MGIGTTQRWHSITRFWLQIRTLVDLNSDIATVLADSRHDGHVESAPSFWRHISVFVNPVYCLIDQHSELPLNMVVRTGTLLPAVIVRLI